MVVPDDFDKGSFSSEVGIWLKKVKGSTGDQDEEVVIIDNLINRDKQGGNQREMRDQRVLSFFKMVHIEACLYTSRTDPV